MINNKKIEHFLCFGIFLNLIALIIFIAFAKANGYLPSPFFIDKSNTFMDFFNLIYAANNHIVYTEYKSIYPSLVFILAKFACFIFNECQGIVGDVIRDNSKKIIITLLVSSCLIPFFVTQTATWSSFSKKSRLLLSIFIVTSVPYLFAVERGNSIIVVPLLITFIFIFKSEILKIFWLALIANIKPYLVISSWKYLCNAKEFVVYGLITLFIFTIAGLIFDNSSYYLIFGNIIAFSSDNAIVTVRGILDQAASLSVFNVAIGSLDGHSKFHFQGINLIAIFCQTIRFVAAATFISVLFLRRQYLSYNEAILLSIIFITNIAYQVGGYSLILYYPLVPIFCLMRYSHLYLILIFIIFLPIDTIHILTQQVGLQHSFISNSDVYVNWNFTAGTIIRPILNFLLQSLATFEIYKRTLLIQLNKP